jgi:hypothetical protein
LLSLEGVKQANVRAKHAGITDERALAMEQGYTSKRADTFDTLTFDVVPGASLLIRKALRTVIVTDKNVHLFQGNRLSKEGARLGTYPVEEGVIRYQRGRLILPEGHVIRMNLGQANLLLEAVHMAPLLDPDFQAPVDPRAEAPLGALAMDLRKYFRDSWF